MQSSLSEITGSWFRPTHKLRSDMRMLQIIINKKRRQGDKTGEQDIRGKEKQKKIYTAAF
jgi:hypothetical protein